MPEETNRTIRLDHQKKSPKKEEPLKTSASAPIREFRSAEINRMISPHSARLTTDHEYAESLLSREDDEKFQDSSNCFEMLGSFAEGGYGKILLAQDKNLKRFIAVKQLKSEIMNDAHLRRRFIQESRITAQLDHPNIIPVYSIWESNTEGVSLAMKLINGKTLREALNDIILDYKSGKTKLSEEKNSLSKRLEIFLNVCNAISYAHSRKMMHCDLKPENIIIGEFHETYVMDWGIARSFEPGESENESGTQDKDPDKLEGTPAYMAPETLKDKIQDDRSDIFALGLILYEITTLMQAATGTDQDDVMMKIMTGNLDPVNHRYPSVSIDADLRAIIEKACAMNPDDRYQNAAALADDVRRYMRFAETTARPDSPLMKITRWTYHHRTLATSIVAGIILVLSLLTSILLYARMMESQTARLREKVMAALFIENAKIAISIDRHMLHLENIISDFATDAGMAMESELQGKPKKIFSSSDVGYPEKAAEAGMRKSTQYGNYVSFKEPLSVLQPDSNPEYMKRISFLKNRFVAALFFSIPGSFSREKDLTEEEVANSPMPLKWIYTGFDDGTFIGFPGSADLPPGYDPRTRPWYIDGMKHNKLKWCKPYLDINGQGIVIPCTVPIKGKSGKIYGVIGLDMAFDYIFKILFKTESHSPHIIEKLIMDNQGRVVISSKMKSMAHQERDNKIKDDVNFPEFNDKAAMKTILASDNGILPADDDNDLLYTYTIVPILSWHYIEIIDFEKAVEEFRKAQN